MSRPLLSLLLSAALVLAPGLSRGEVEAPREVPRIAQPLVPTAKPSVLVGELKTEHFAISYTARGEGAARRLSGELEGLRARFADQLGRDWPGVTSVRVGFGREELEAISVPGGRPPPWAAALAYPDLHLVLLEAGALATEDGTRTVLHELSHAALGQLGGTWPHWFQEGLAMHLSGERVSFRQYTALARAVGADRVVRLSALDRDWPEHLQQVEEAYAESLSFVDFLLGAHGPEAFGALVDRVAAGERFEGAFASAFGTSLSLEETRWRAQLPSKYASWFLLQPPDFWWGWASVLCVLAFVLTRVRVRRRRLVLEAEEAAELAAARILAAEEAAFLARSGIGDPGAPAENDAEDEEPPPILH